jgi:hypothetical protein
VGKPEGRRPLGRPGRKWVDNIKMDLREIGWGGVVWLRIETSGCWEILEWLSHWRCLNKGSAPWS